MLSHQCNKEGRCETLHCIACNHYTQGSKGHKKTQKVGRDSGGLYFNFLIKSGSAIKSDQVIQGFVSFMQDASKGQHGTKAPFLSGMQGLNESQGVE